MRTRGSGGQSGRSGELGKRGWERRSDRREEAAGPRRRCPGATRQRVKAAELGARAAAAAVRLGCPGVEVGVKV